MINKLLAKLKMIGFLKVIIKRKLIRCGNSIAITIPKEIIKYNVCNKGSFIYVKILNETDISDLELSNNE
jgi:hypothetical protein